MQDGANPYTAVGQRDGLAGQPGGGRQLLPDVGSGGLRRRQHPTRRQELPYNPQTNQTCGAFSPSKFRRSEGIQAK